MTSRFGAREELPTTTNPNSIFGALVLGLDAVSPTGTNATEDVVADFTGGTVTVLGDASRTLPVTVTSVQATGTTIKISERGRYLVTAFIPIIGAVTVHVGLGIDNPAAELNANPVWSNTIFARTIAVGVAALTMPISVSGIVKISQLMADTATLGLVRLLLSNGAGAGPAAAALSVADVAVKVERLGDYNAP